MHKSLFDIILLALMWGPSFLFMKIAINDIPPFTLVALRIGIAAIFLSVLIKLFKIKLPRCRKLWLHSLFMGLVSSSLPFLLFSYSALYIESTLGGVIVGTVPILTVLLAHFFVPDEKISASKIVGIVMGLLGFLIILVPKALAGGVTSEVWGLLGCFVAAFCYAIGMVYSRKFLSDLPSLVVPTTQFITASLYLLPLTFIIDTPLQNGVPCIASLLAILGLSVFGTVLAFIFYFRIVAKSGAVALSTTAYLLPIVGAIFGVIFLNESLDRNFYLATIFIFLGVLFANKQKKS